MVNASAECCIKKTILASRLMELGHQLVMDLERRLVKEMGRQLVMDLEHQSKVEMGHQLVMASISWLE